MNMSERVFEACQSGHLDEKPWHCGYSEKGQGLRAKLGILQRFNCAYKMHSGKDDKHMGHLVGDTFLCTVGDLNTPKKNTE